jgi:hypothetical protein
MFSPLRWGDHVWVRDRFPRESGAAVYSDSWLYLTQACRGALGSLGGYYRDRGFFVGLGLHRDSWVLVRPIGRPPEGFLGKLARFVAESGKSPWVYVKKPGLLGGVEPRPWNANAPADDDTYPEYIVDTRLARKLAEARGRRGQRLRWQLRQCESLRLVRDSLASAGAAAGLRQFLRDHFGNEPEAVSSYENMIEILSSEDSSYWSHYLVRDEHRRVVGFFAYEWVDVQSVGVYASLAARSITGLSERLMLELFDDLSRIGARWANLGGSESESLDQYKRTYAGRRSRRNSLLAINLS